MRNNITTYVKVGNLNDKSLELFNEIFPTNDINTFENINKLYGKSFNENNIPTSEWMEENIGCNSIKIEVDDTFLVLFSTISIPTGYLKKLVETFNDIGFDIVVYGTYEDDEYSLMGAFVYAYDYEDIENLFEDGDINPSDMYGDDDYNDDIYGQLYSHRDSLFEAYLEVKEEREI